MAQTIVFRRLRWQATENDGLPHRLPATYYGECIDSVGGGPRAYEHNEVESEQSVGIVYASQTRPVHGLPHL